MCKTRQNPPDQPKVVKVGGTEAGERAYEAAAAANPSAVVDGHWAQDIVAFSASSYQSWGRCSELFRLEQSGLYDREESDALAVGSIFHTAVAAWKKALTSPK